MYQICNVGAKFPSNANGHKIFLLCMLCIFLLCMFYYICFLCKILTVPIKSAEIRTINLQKRGKKNLNE